MVGRTVTMRNPWVRYGWKAKVLALLVSSLAALILVEVALHLIHVGSPNFYQSDADLGYVLRPGAADWYRYEGRSYIVINRHGMRDIDHAIEKPADTVRIAVLGDSYAEAMQIPLEKAFWSRLRARLARFPAFSGKKVEVLNFGVAGYGTCQEYILLMKRVWKFNPDAVLLAITTGNDIRNNSKGLEPEKIRTFFVLEGDRLVPDYTFRETPRFKRRYTLLYKLYMIFYNHSKLVQVLTRIGYAMALAYRSQGGASGPDSQAGLWEAGLDNMVYLEPKDPKWIEAWRITEGVLGEMHDEIARHGARFFVVTLSNGIQVHPDAQLREKAAAQLGVDDLFYPDRRLKAFLEDHGVMVLSLAPSFQRYAEEHKAFLHGFRNAGELGKGHWNEEGHRLAGDMIAKWIAAKWDESARKQSGY